MSDELYYNNIDELPLFNWRKCQEKQSFEFTRKNIKKGNSKSDRSAWEIIYDSYLLEFGIGKDMERIVSLKLEIAELQIRFVETNEGFLRNQIRELKRELEEFLNRENDSDTNTILTYLRKWMNQWIDPKKITVQEFYYLIRDYKREMQLKKSA
tara:strand:+ start:3182 stop:3643 length:462 start_codon:yes stop_codon:yes gene_type:complete